MLISERDIFARLKVLCIEIFIIFFRIASKIDSLQDSTDCLVNIVSIAVAVLMGIFIITNKGNDSRLIEDGVPFVKIFLGYALISAICAAAVAGISYLVLWLYAGTSFFASACASIVLMFSVPVLVALPVAAVTVLIYLKIIYR